MRPTQTFVRSRGALLIVAGLVLAVLLSAWVTSGDRSHGGALDPQSSDPSGARALAQVLGAQGVELDIVRDDRAFADAGLEDATLLITSADHLARSTVLRVLQATASTTVIVVDPQPYLIRLMRREESIPTTSAPAAPVAAQCADTRLTGLELGVDRAAVYPKVDGGCFPEAGGVLFAPQVGGLTFFGAGEALSNAQITRADNAAVALRLLGERDRLVWYVPSLADLEAGDEVGLGTLLPEWLRPALWLVGLSLLALALWRGRRLGPLVREPLPVVVKAIETTQSRARLYRKARDRRHTTWTLRAAALRRAAARLGLDRRTDETAVISEVSRHTGFAYVDIATVLSQDAPVPTSDRELDTLADHLASLDEHLRKAPR